MNTNFEKKQKATLLVVIITAFITTFTGSALNLSVPTVGEEFNASASLVGWIVTAYMLTSAGFSVPFGRVSDIASRKKILVCGILIFSLSSLLAAFAWNIQILLAIRALQGFGAAMIFSTNIAVLVSSFPGEDRGRVLGYSTASTYIGLSAGPVIGGFFNHYLGWRSIFLVTFAVSAVVFFIAWRKLPKDERQLEKTNLDLLGNILYILMIPTVLYGLSAFSTSNLAKILLPVGLVLLVLFGRHELKVDNPIVELRLFANNLSYSFSNIAALLNYGATFAIGYLLSIYLQVVMGYTSQIAGIILIAQPVVMALLSPLAGRLSDKVSPFKLASFGMALCAVSLFALSFISEAYPLWTIVAALVVAGVGFAFFSSPNTNAIMACVEKTEYGVASSLLATMRNIGHTSSMAVVTVVVGIYMGNKALAEAEPQLLISTMHASFLIFTGICAVGTIFSLKRKA
ncbi:MFS transporter [Clostridium aminobutyricum]|uniref:MFS transporter n=1 Tax=Clostridium aminobutyricum TaxID=33953 RepID=A0A939D725_CLOAM|nr:MFS transporter [Clostridium aminobutyricum]MBN7771933.1 MFS transporter [Clostridium aminobutyricum]